MSRTFATWLDTTSATDYELRQELDRELEGLAYDLKVCGRGYPSPRKESIRKIVAEQERRKRR